VLTRLRTTRPARDEKLRHGPWRCSSTKSETHGRKSPQRRRANESPRLDRTEPSRRICAEEESGRRCKAAPLGEHASTERKVATKKFSHSGGGCAVATETGSVNRKEEREPPRRRRTLTYEEKNTQAARTRLNEIQDWAGPYSAIRTSGWRW
jgi:hypothetical protein